MIVFSDLIIRGRLSLFQFNLEIYTNNFTLPKFPIVKRIDEFDFNFHPSINKQEILELKSLGFLNNHQNILLVGSPGVGKTHLAIGLGLIACEHGFKTLFINCHDLLLVLRTADSKGTLERQMKRYSNCELLIIDEIGYLPMKPYDANLLFQLVNNKFASFNNHHN